MLFPPSGALYYETTIAARLGTTLLFGMNSGPRDSNKQARQPVEVPERLIHGYSQKEFQDFQKIATAKVIGGTSTLELYRRRVLLLDIGFCVFCAMASFLLWGLLEKAALSEYALSFLSNHVAAASVYSWAVSKICFVGAVFSVLYGFIDAAEDVTLIYLLAEQEPTSFEVHFASFLTVAKVVTIACSGILAPLFSEFWVQFFNELVFECRVLGNPTLSRQQLWLIAFAVVYLSRR